MGLGLVLVGCAGATGVATAAGVFSTGHPIAVKNLTIADGLYRVGYSMEVFYAPQASDSVLHCQLVDTSGRIDFFDTGVSVVEPGHWTRVSYEDVFDLPELTLGIRCEPSEETALTVQFRHVAISAAVETGRN